MAGPFDFESPAVSFARTQGENLRRQARHGQQMADAAAASLAQAEDAVSDLVIELEAFEHNLSAAEEARIVIIGGPGGTMIFPTVIGPRGHDRIVFEGADQNGCRVVVMQHVSQLNVMVKAIRVVEGEARRIGFHSLGDDTDA